MPSVLVDISPLRQSRDFRLLWTGQLVSWIGSRFTVVAIPYQVYVMTGSSFKVGLLGLVEAVPLITFGLLGGTIADAFDRRRLMLITQILLAATSTALAIGSIGLRAPLWLLYLLAAVAAGVSALDIPTRAAAVPRLVTREQLPAALALNAVLWNVGDVAGPALGGLVLAQGGLPWAYWVDVATFAASMVTVFMLSPQPPDHAASPPGFQALKEGLRFARSHKALLGSFAADLDAMVFGMPKALFPALAATAFHVGPGGLGLLFAAPAFGALGGALLTGWVARVRRHGRAVLVAIAVWGGAIAVFGLCGPLFPLALLLLGVAGAADSISAVIRNLILQGEAPEALRGRLTAVFIVVVRGGVPLGDIEAGTVAALTSPVFSVVSGGLACMAGIGVIAVLLPSFRRYHLMLGVNESLE
jgi:MFS family permease